MPWFCKNQYNQQTTLCKRIEMSQGIFMLLLICCSMEKCSSFSPQMSKRVSLRHASTAEGKTTILEIGSKPVTPILSRENQPKVKKQHKRNNNGQQWGHNNNSKYRRPVRYKCSKAQNAKRKIRFLYSKAR